MKRTTLGLIAGLVWAAAAHGAEGEFSATVRAADFSAAGLAKLTPAELARLDALVRDYKSGALATVKREAAAAERAREAAEARAAQATAEARSAQTAAAARTAKTEKETGEPKKADAGLIAKARALLPAGTTVEYAAVESRIAGNFSGWQGRTVFTLENGQRWQVVNAGEYFSPTVRNPVVRISPASFGGFWMTIEGVNQRVRVASLEAGR
jgi:biotin carboxyl carrier protein